MPEYVYRCPDCEMEKTYQRKVEERHDPVACDCYSPNPMKLAITAHSAYYIGGDNSASQRPKQAGSFRGKVRK